MLLIYALRLLHLLIMLFVVAAWLLPSPLARAVHLGFVPLLMLLWQANDGACFLTQIERRWRARHYQKQVPPLTDKVQGAFTRRLMTRLLCGRTPSDHVLKLLIYGVLWSSWSFSAYLLFIAY